MSSPVSGAPTEPQTGEVRFSLALRFAQFHLLLALMTALVAGVLSVLLRWQVGLNGRPLPLAGPLGLFPATGGVIPPEAYGQLFTLHGAGMFFYALLPGLGAGLATLALGLHRGKLPPALSGLLVLGAIVHGLGWLCLVVSPWGGMDGPAAGWSYYPPLAAREWSPGWGLNLYLLALALWGAGAVCAALVQIVGQVSLNRGESLRNWTRMDPWRFGHLAAALCTVFAVPSLLLSVGLLLADRMTGTTFLDPIAGNPVLHQHLFWFFGHPAVYILILPVMGFFTAQLLAPDWVGRWPHRLANVCMASIAILGFAAWGHHMFQSGLDPRISGRFSTATLLISWPSALLVALWILMATRRARLSARPGGYWHGVAFLVTFSAGGVGGVLLATAPLNAHLHETYWVVGHIHLVLFGGSLLGLVGALFVLGGEYLRRSPGRGLMLAHLALSVPLLLVAFGLMHWLGYQGLGRRMYQVPDLPGLLGVRAANRAVTLAAMALVLVQGILLVALVDGMGWIRLWMSILWVRMTAVIATGHVLGGCVILWRDGWSLWIVGAIGIGCLVGAWTAWRVAPDGSPVNFVPIVGDKSEAVAYGRG